MESKGKLAKSCDYHVTQHSNLSDMTSPDSCGLRHIQQELYKKSEVITAR